MPSIVSQEELADGLRITCINGKVYTGTSNDLPPAIRNGTLAQCEAFVNNFLDKAIRQDGGESWFAKVHVLNIVPLKVILVTSKIPIPDYDPAIQPWRVISGP